MNDETSVLIEDRGRVRILTLNRPERLNAFNIGQYDGVRAGLDDAAENPEISVAVITGTGRAFSAGQDLGEMGNAPAVDDSEPHGFLPFVDTLQSFPKPLIAAVNGIGVGIGVTILPHCDLVLIARGARLRAPFVSLGIAAEAGSTVLLPALIGWAETAHLLYTTDWVSAEKAVKIGLAWRCVDDDALMDETLALADRIASMPVTALVANKKLLLAPRLDAINSARERENIALAGLVGGPANREAILAFMEKREPDFSKVMDEA